VGDEIEIKPQKLGKKIFQHLKERLKTLQFPSYLVIDPENLKVKVVEKPKVEDLQIPVDLHAVFEFYAK
jgi:ribosomal protein S4